jgi:RNA polymerase sigma-70 factor (ECF subfamily)
MGTSSDGPDHALVAAFLSGRGEPAFRALYRRHTPRMLRLGRRLALRSAVSAEDVVQEAWIRAIRLLDRFEGRSALSSWLGGIVVNVVREQRRKPAELAVGDAYPAPEWADPIAGMTLARSLRDLPAGFRSVVALHDVAGFTHAEIAGILGIDPGTSKSQLARARKRLRRALDAESDGKDPGHAP